MPSHPNSSTSFLGVGGRISAERAVVVVVEVEEEGMTKADVVAPVEMRRRAVESFMVLY